MRPPNRVRRNIVANFAGRIATILAGIVFVPVYLALLGAEGYGLVALFATVQSVLALFDFGIGTTVTREIAIDAGKPDRRESTRNLTRTLEFVYWIVALVLGAGWVSLSPLVSAHWLHSSSLAGHETTVSLILMGVAAALQFPFAFYGGGLIGLERQVAYNYLVIAGAVLRGLGAVVVLAYVSARPSTFFAWQAAVSLMQSVAAAAVFWSEMPSTGQRAIVQWSRLVTVWRFAAGTGATVAISAVRAQVDKVLLSRYLPLDAFGFYSLAAVLASTVAFLGTPLYIVYLPRFAALTAADQHDAVVSNYHDSAQLVAAIVLPAAAVASMFASQVMFVWTGNASAAASVSTVAPLLIAGYAFVALNGIPYNFQLAAGWPQLGLRLGAIALVVGVPIMVWATKAHGSLGAAAAWTVISASYTCASVLLMHRRLLKGELAHWASRDVLVPAVVSVACAYAFRLFLPGTLGRAGIAIYLVTASCVCLAATALAMPVTRRVLRGRLRPAGAV